MTPVETNNPPRRTVVLGIDPGRSTGLYSASIPTLDRALTLPEFERDGRWLGNAVISLSTRESITKLEAWSEMQQRIERAVDDTAAGLIVIEYPADRLASWSGGSAQGTEFHMGMFFGFAALAAERAHYTSHAPIALMPVTSSKAKQRVGWMPKVTERSRNGKRLVTHTQSQEATLSQCRAIAMKLGEFTETQEERDVDALSDHELMALGVLTYYVTNRSPSEWGK